MILPKFGNQQHENPLEYLTDLKNVFNLQADPEKSKLVVVKNSLIGNYSSWFEIYIDMSICYDQSPELWQNAFSNAMNQP